MANDNLASDPRFEAELIKHRSILDRWILDSGIKAGIGGYVRQRHGRIYEEAELDSRSQHCDHEAMGQGRK